MLDPREFRDALGRFATGVTIVTTRDGKGRPVGVTVSSYNSVSLDPPLVLWSLAKTASSLAAFEQAKAFTIHVLGRNQQELASRFARSGEDKFGGLNFGEAHGGVPLLPGCAAHFECESAYQYEGGDHVIFVGQVIRFDRIDTLPLLFHRGKFSEVRQPTTPPLDSSKPHGRYTDDFLPYLLGRAQMQFTVPIRRHCRELGLSDAHYATMGLLSMLGSVTGDELARRLDFTGQAPTTATLAEMAERGWIEERAEEWHLSAKGREIFLSVLSRLRAWEEEVLEDFDPEQLEHSKAFLRKLIEETARGLPPLLDDA
jgi:3-hydroxy-9,10-secoandrosta-1,3,5(10)-triene-9,17-dione monooxygenase reductase component